MSTDDPLPGVSEIDDPQHETPVTAEFETGTANDPPVGTDGEDPTTLSVDDTQVTVPPGSTVIDAMQIADDEVVSVDPGAGNLDEDVDVPALCYYDRGGDANGEIGPWSECRTCMVETDEHGVVPSCPFPAIDGLRVETNTSAAEESRSVNLGLVLSNHNLCCTTCNENGRREFQETAVGEGVDHPHYGVFDDRSEHEPLDDSSSFIQIDRNKCILCNRYVEGCNDMQVEGVLRIEGSGEDTRIGFQSDAEMMADSDCVSCRHCATVCPTGALTEKDIGGTGALPPPGFTQRNSVGQVTGREDVEALDDTTAPNRSPGPGSSGTAGGEAESGRAGREKRSSVARYMAQSKRRMPDSLETYGRKAMLADEHTVENLTARTLPESRLFDVASLVSSYRLSNLDKVETTCGFCAVGCRLEMWGKDGNAIGVQPVDDPDNTPANNFSTCVKGKFSHDFANGENRLTKPLIRNEDGEFEAASWDEALDYVVDRLREIQDEHGVSTVSCLTSSKGSNEEAYLVQKFARQVLDTKNTDNCARLCHSSTVAAFQQTLGCGTTTNRINENIGEADAYLINGSNTTESHSVLTTRIKQNVRDEADLMVFDPRKIDIAEHANQYTRTTPGYDVVWLNGLIRYLIEHDLHDEELIERNTKGFVEAKWKVQASTPERVEGLAGISPDELKSAAETLADAENVVFGWVMEVTQSSHRTKNLLAMADLALTLGQVGKPGAGLSPFRDQNNVQGGGGDVETLPGSLPGYQDPADDEVDEKFTGVWGERPPVESGLKVPEMLPEAHEGNLRGTYIVGENPAFSEPDIRHAGKALEGLDFLVAQDIFMTEAAEHADVILPTTISPEKHGTFANTERRVQRVRASAEPPGRACQDWGIAQELAARLGYDWGYDHPREIMDEISELTPIYGGISYKRLDSGDKHGLQWPCWDDDHLDTPYLYDCGGGNFNFDGGLVCFVPTDGGHPGELPDEEFPLTLTSGRVLYHWYTGQIIRRVEDLTSYVGENFIEINPMTAAELDVSDGEYVRVESRRSDIAVEATVTDRVGDGTLFIPMHFVAGAVNKFTQEVFDSQVGIPEFKVSNVRVEPLGPNADPDVLRTPDTGAGSTARGDN